MVLFSVPREQAMAVLGAMRAVVDTDGKVADAEAKLLEATARLLAVDVPVSDLKAVTPAEAAAAVTDPAHRTMLVQAMIVASMIDREASDAEAATIGTFVEALQVGNAEFDSLKKVIAGHVARARVDMARRGEPGKVLGRAWAEQGVKGIFKFFGGPAGVYTDPETAWRYKQLGLLPEGTLGRAYWAHCTANRFAFPGEHKGLSEWLVVHDMMHVVSGCDTTPVGELCLGAFQAGNVKGTSGFYMLFGVALVFLLGHKLPGDLIETAATDVDPALLVDAMARGARVSQNLMTDWDYWQDVARPLGEVRARLGISVGPAT